MILVQTMLTKNLIANVATATGMTRKRAEEMLNATTAVMREALMAGKTISVQGVGTLEVRQRGERAIVHPRTGEKGIIPAKNQLYFKPSGTIKDELKRL